MKVERDVLDRWGFGSRGPLGRFANMAKAARTETEQVLSQTREELLLDLLKRLRGVTGRRNGRPGKGRTVSV
jgi:hypothetical protein